MVRLIWGLEIFGKALAVWLATTQPAAWPVVVAFFTPDLLVFYHLFAPSGGGFCPVITGFKTTRREVWLTIDDGPDPVDTPQILDLLDRHDARATFFVIGVRAQAHPELVREIVRRGHEIGHHTHHHPVASFWCAGPRRLARELDEALAVFRALDLQVRWFRAPVGIKNVFLAPALAQRGLRAVAWSIRSGDCNGRDADVVATRTVNRVKPGSIVLLHEGPSLPAALRVRTLARVLELLAARDFRCVLPHAGETAVAGGLGLSSS